MYSRLKPLIKWPSREQLRKTMPAVFLPHFRKCVFIKDCFEVFCEQPSDLLARAQTYSNYKSHNTINVLTFSNRFAPVSLALFASATRTKRFNSVITCVL